jgi:two-component system CheB/CheR fusion protein
VAIAHAGADGVEAARRAVPDAVFCDVGLPDVSGYAVARAFREDPALRAVFMVALTGYALPDDVERAREAGFDEHLAKPPAIARIDEILAKL